MKITNEEFQSLYELEVLEPSECVENFSCGDDDLDDFIINESLSYGKALLAVTYIVREQKTAKVVAYFSLAADKLSVTDFVSNSEFNRFRKRRFVHEKRLRSYPAVKLCRLGVDKSVCKSGLGSILLAWIVYYCTHGNRFACRFLTVDAYLSAIPFYEKNGFLPLTGKETEHTTKLMYFDLASTIDK